MRTPHRIKTAGCVAFYFVSCIRLGPEVIKLSSLILLNSAEHEIFYADKHENAT